MHLVGLFCLQCRFVQFGYSAPIDDVPERRDVIRTPVMIFQVVGMFPDIQSQNRRSPALGHIHDRIILVGRGANTKLSFGNRQPGPAAAKTGGGRIGKLLFERVKTAEVLRDGVREFTGWLPSGLGADPLPKKRMVVMPPAVITDRRAYFFRS